MLVLALLALLALGVAGATLNDPTAATGDGLFGGGPNDAEGDDGPGTNVTTGGERPPGGANFTGPCLEDLDTLPVRAGLTLLVVGLSAVVARRSGAPLLAGGLTFLLTGLLAHLLFTLLTACGPLMPAMSPSRGASAGATPDELGNGSGGAGPEAMQNAVSDPSFLLGVLLALAIAAAVLLLVFASGDTDAPVPDAEDEEPEPEPDVAAVGRAAGRAADRIDDGEDGFENDVYRAWVEMTDHLAVAHPESSTPAEFADAAVEAGMDAADVRELTTLFEEARYGDYAVTDERESRAVAALRRIESQYADADDGARTDGGGLSVDGGRFDDERSGEEHPGDEHAGDERRGGGRR